jgi:hypothetical protein
MTEQRILAFQCLMTTRRVQSTTPLLEHGIIRAFSAVLGGIILTSLLHALADSGLIEPSYLVLLNLANILGIISISLLIKYWGTLYILGWLLGLIMLSPGGLVDPWEMIVYLAVAIIVLFRRFLRKF